MNVNPILNKLLPKVTPSMHKTRRASLISMLDSLVKGSAATVTNIGRGIKGKAQEKHRIKRADRLLSNAHLQYETIDIYRSLSQLTIGNTHRPIILVDWSDLDEYKRHFLLRATLASHSRGLCVYEEVHCIKTKEKPLTHQQFLAQLASILPSDCKPIIVTDAGFKTPWFRQVKALGWDFIGRTRLGNFYSTDGEQWQCVSHLYQQATSTPKAFSGSVVRANPLDCQLVIYKQPNKGRHALNRSGKPKQSKAVKVHQKSARDPWLLSSSIPLGKQLAKRVVKIYRLRMQIEEGFRDMKSRRFGQGFEYNKTTDIRRLSVLILLTTLAHWFLMILGTTATLLNLHRRYQANSTKHTRTLSLHFIGRRVAVDRSIKISTAQVIKSICHLKLQSEGAKYHEL